MHLTVETSSHNQNLSMYGKHFIQLMRTYFTYFFTCRAVYRICKRIYCTEKSFSCMHMFDLNFCTCSDGLGNGSNWLMIDMAINPRTTHVGMGHNSSVYDVLSFVMIDHYVQDRLSHNCRLWRDLTCIAHRTDSLHFVRGRSRNLQAILKPFQQYMLHLNIEVCQRNMMDGGYTPEAPHQHWPYLKHTSILSNINFTLTTAAAQPRSDKL